MVYRMADPTAGHKRPVIGICTVLEKARWSVWELDAALLPMNYVKAVQRAGGLALMLAPDEQLIEEPEEILAMLDGLILAGGADIDPASYGEPRDPHTVDTVPERDRFEIALARAAIEGDVPLLGICRGMQLINVAMGGSLYQDLPTQLPGKVAHLGGDFDRNIHSVRFTEDGSFARMFGGPAGGSVVSIHHQGIKRFGRDLVVEATAEDDVVEAIRWKGRSFVCAVQWHPEFHQQAGTDLIDCNPLLESFLAAARP
jgi:putative glutamine amidotransferase